MQGARYAAAVANRNLPAYYLKVRAALWQGHIQDMSAAALATLLILQVKQESGSGAAWWSVITFPARIRISSSMCDKGTKELQTAAFCA